MRNYSRRHYREFQEGPCPGRFLALGRVTCHPARCYWLDFRSRLKNRKPLAGIDECRDDWLRQHCRNYGPIILSQRSETSFGSHPCRVVSVTYEKNGCCHGRRHIDFQIRLNLDLFMIHETFLCLTETALGTHPCRVVSATYHTLRPFHGDATDGMDQLGIGFRSDSNRLLESSLLSSLKKMRTGCQYP